MRNRWCRRPRGTSPSCASLPNQAPPGEGAPDAGDAGDSSSALAAAALLTNYQRHAADGRGFVFTSDTGQKLRLTPYGDAMVRVQVAGPTQGFLADDHY